MKKLIAIVILTGLLATACQPAVNETLTPIPVKDMGILWAEQEAPDDIMPAPGLGPAYRANIHQQGEENPWPPIGVSEAFLGSGSNEAHIYYRNHIETVAGETRNNVIKVIMPGKDVNSLSLYAIDVPAGITLTDGGQWSGPSARASVLVIEIAPDIAPGEYPLEIGLEINGKDYGMVTCRINVSSIADIVIQPVPGNYLSAGDEPSRVILKVVQIRADVCDKDYHSPWFPSVKKGESCLVVSGHVQNQDKEKFEIAMSALGYDEAGEIVAGTLDAAHIAGAIGLHLEYGEIGEFTLHLNLSENISTIRISAANSLITPP